MKIFGLSFSLKKKVMTVPVVFHTHENVRIRPLKEKCPSVSSVWPLTLTSRMLSSCFGRNIVLLGVYAHMTLIQDGQEQEQTCPKRADRSKIQRVQVWCGCSDDAGRVTHTKFILTIYTTKKSDLFEFTHSSVNIGKSMHHKAIGYHACV